MISAYYKHLLLSVRKAYQKIVKNLNRLGRGNRFVIYIPGNKNRLRTFPVD